MGVTDANSAGFVHGGAVMRYCDEAAGLAATRHSGHRVVTAAMDRMTFLEPVHVGEVLTFKDRKSTRLNSSHANISNAVFFLKKKTKIKIYTEQSVKRYKFTYHNYS